MSPFPTPFQLGLVSGLSEGIAWLKGSRSNINASYNVTCEPVNHHPLQNGHNTSQQQRPASSNSHYPPAAGLPPPTPRSARTPHKGLDGPFEPYTPKIMGATTNASNNHLAVNHDAGGSNIKRYRLCMVVTLESE